MIKYPCAHCLRSNVCDDSAHCNEYQYRLKKDRKDRERRKKEVEEKTKKKEK